MAGSITTSISRRVGSSLRLRVLMLTLAAFVAVAVPAAAAFVWIVDRTVVTLGTMFAERQILYDRYRGLEVLRREVALAETLMRSPTIIDWALDEFDRDRYARGIAELEHFRRTFVDRSYFFVVGASGNYYFNDHDGTYTGAQRRYAVSPANPNDEWYYKTLAAGPGCHLNVNHDDVLSVTKVWMNCVVEHEGRILGLVGTGIDLTMFLRNVVETDQNGVESMFVDRSGAVQASRDESLIDFRSLTKEDDAKTTFFQLLENAGDRTAFAAMMREVTDQGTDAASARFMNVNGTKMLVGIGHLRELGWYNVTIMDVDQIIDRRLFGPIACLLGLMMLAAAALVTLLFKRSVLDRLQRAEASMQRIEAGDFSQSVEERGTDEIARLSRALNRMALAVGTDRAELEEAVRQRTEQLERIAYVDQLSGVLNRRGFIEAYTQEERRLAIDEALPGLLILDIDNFKTVNDNHGHIVGDEVIAEVARRLLDVTREQDLCARWGGDEFVVIVKSCDARALAGIGSKILDAIRARPVELLDGTMLRIGTSIGAHLVEPADTLESAASKADLALYAAKRQGRNRMVVYDREAHGPAKVSDVA
ncbi:diguanylate cyclase [Mesorhizobium microcysteis]|uniref:diguanylate cyclase n=1 Tax=Neoaquamicrobium microcysteis TaxID=2682781 RepID=A0A5D4GR32_9HYPH|nr:diguanylate cyclase [Mesorhizobium microcysteis]TYR29785.1 diguanylate cyclase [Mesorhizobium microcysteis]